MDWIDYYNDRKFCETCADYVPYLMSLEHSYCTHCGGQVRLFSEKDWETFNESIQAKRKGGRPPKERKNKESA